MSADGADGADGAPAAACLSLKGKTQLTVTEESVSMTTCV